MAFRDFLPDVATPAPRPANTVPTATSQLASALPQAAALVEGAVHNYQKSQLVGEEDVKLTDLPGLQDLNATGGISRQDAASKLEVDALTSLNQIKLARQQGLITAARARLQTNKVIREVSSGNPGMESVLRGKAGEFFGQFGPGDMLLQETGAETFAQSAREAMIKEGVKHGIINSINPLSDTQGILAWQKMQSGLAIAEYNKTTMESHLKTGDVSVEQYSQQYMQARVEPIIAGTINDIKMMVEQGGKIANPQEIAARLKVTEQQLISDLNGKLTQIPGASTQSIKAQIESIKSRFTDLNELAKTGKLVDFINQQSDLITAMAKRDMIKRFPQMLGMEVAFPNLGKDMLAYGDKWQSMVPAQRANFEKTIQNPFLREAFRGMVDSNDHFAMGDTIQQALQSNIVPTDEWTKTYVDSFALDSARNGNPATEPANSSGNASVEYVLKNVDEKGTLEYLSSEPTVVARIRMDRGKQLLLKNRVMSSDVNVANQIQQSLLDEDFFPEDSVKPIGQLVYDKTTQQFQMVFEKEVVDRVRSLPEHVRQAESKALLPRYIEDLNSMNRAIDTYSVELGIVPESWREDVVRRYNNTINQILDSRIRVEEERIKAEEEKAKAKERDVKGATSNL